MSSIRDMESLWATYFTTPFPKSSSKFWTKYPAQTIEAGFEAMSRKLQAGHTFSTLADACRFNRRHAVSVRCETRRGATCSRHPH